MSEWDKISALPDPPQYICYKSNLSRDGELADILDGRLDKAAWQKVPWTEDFVDIIGAARASVPAQKTRVKMLWDNLYFYVGAELHETDIWGTLQVKNSTMYHENDFEVFLDPDRTHHNYFEFEMNCLNTIWELVLNKPYKDGHSIKNPYNLQGTRSAVHTSGPINDPKASEAFQGKFRGWSIEIAFPLSELRQFNRWASSSSPAGEIWGINFSRVQWPLQVNQNNEYVKVPNSSEDNWVWSPTGVVDIHRPERWARVLFSPKHCDSNEVFEDFTYPIRSALMAVYYHQRSYFERNKEYASTFKILDYESQATSLAMFAIDPEDYDRLTSLEDVKQYELSSNDVPTKGYIVLGMLGDTTWFIRHDGLLWSKNVTL